MAGELAKKDAYRMAYKMGLGYLAALNRGVAAAKVEDFYIREAVIRDTMDGHKQWLELVRVQMEMFMSVASTDISIPQEQNLAMAAMDAIEDMLKLHIPRDKSRPSAWDTFSEYRQKHAA